MVEYEDLVRRSYAAYNTRDLPVLLSALAPDVEWPDQLEGGTLRGVEAVGAYWKLQWKVLNPSVELMHFEMDRNGHWVASVLQIVRGTDGVIISKGLVRQVYVFENGLVRSMRLLL